MHTFVLHISRRHTDILELTEAKRCICQIK
nr:MAG TPA: hypothetical protein [Caudoviricetes sp.]